MKALTERIRRLLLRKQSYRECFQQPSGDELTKSGAYVMRDLARFCGVYKSNTPLTLNKSVDPVAMGIAEGRRQVYLRILSQLTVTEAEIIKANEEDV